MIPLVTVQEPERKQYLLLTPGTHPPRLGPTYQVQADSSDLPAIIADAQKSEVLAVDFETRGGDISDDISIVGIGLAWDSGSIYIHWIDLFENSRALLVDLILHHPGLIAHNVGFDGGVVFTQFGRHARWLSCTYNLVASLANESPEQRWGLKHLMTSLLGWPEANDAEMDEWLVTHGYYKGNKLLDNSPEALRVKFQAGTLRADKGEMWRTPRQILGKYCVLDAEACYLLYTRVLYPAATRFPELLKHHQECLHSIRLHIEQKILGIPIDRDMLAARREVVLQEIYEREMAFRQHPEVLPSISLIESDLLTQLQQKEPARYKKNHQESKNWQNWLAKFESAAMGNIPEYKFNLNSDPQLRHLFYQLLEYPVKLTTESGQPATSNRALKAFGEAGQILIDFNYSVKELGFLDGYIEMTAKRPTIHPSFRTPGTVTGRLSSREPNLQQVPKSKAMMSLFRAREGMAWVDIDFCLHPDTEYLTRDGWKVIESIGEEDYIWQVNPETREGSWTLPLRIIRRNYAGKMYAIGNRRGVLHVTENHRMLWTNQLNRGRPYKHIINQSQEGIPNAYVSSILTSSMSDHRGYCPTYQELNTVCLLQADSYFNGESYSIQLAMPKKREEAAHLLGHRGRVYPPRSFQNLEVEHWSNICFSSPLLRGKSLYLEELDSANADALVSCLATWDGSRDRSGRTVIYGSTDYTSVDQVQRYLVRCGYECKLNGRQPKYPGSKYFYTLIIRKAKGLRLRKGIDDIRAEEYSGLVGCVTVPTGCILVRSGGQTFVTGNCALEPVVATEFSGDENMAQIYGNGKPLNDIYIFVMAHIPGMAERARALGYDPYNPTPDSLARVKKQMKHERGICKTVVLACQYGAGVNKIMQTLEADGILLSYEEVALIHSSYWNLFAQLKDFSKSLEYEWRRNKGYILNGLGRPMAVSEDYRKDLLNRFVQSTGHDILVKYIYILTHELDRRKIQWKPLIIDFHDATTVEVLEQESLATVAAMNRSMDLLNEQLGGNIRLRGIPVIGRTLSEVKEPSE